MTDLDIERSGLDDLAILTEVSQLLTLLDLDEVLRKVVELSARAVGADIASLLLYDGDKIDLARIIDTEQPGMKDNKELVSRILDEGLAGWVVRNKQPVLLNETFLDDRWLKFKDFSRELHSALCIPFIYREQVVAVLTLAHAQPHRFTPHHLRIMTLVASQATVAIRHAQLFKRINMQEHQLEVVLRAIPDPLFVLDENGRILLANATAVPLIGKQEPQKLLGQRLTDFTEVDSALVPVQQIIKEIEESPLNSGTNWSFETRSEARKQDFQVSMSAWEDREQDLMGYIVVMHDVTTLRDLHRFKDEMLRIATHDLRSPLSLIVGYTDLIGMDTPDPNSPVHEYVSVIRKSTERMSDLVEELLRVERIRSSPLELHEQIDVQKLIKVVIVNMRPLAEQQHLQFETQLDLDDVPGIMADPVLIRQTMENLIGNAIKYTPDSGKVTVKAFAEKGQFHFVVEDTGVGIPKDALPYIFNSFFRVRNKATEKISGVGLGLSLVKTVIERHNGQVWVESEEGKGSQFGFKIPLPLW